MHSFYCIYLLSEVFVNDLVGQPINVLVLVVLEFFNLFQSICLFNLSGNDLVVGSRHLQDVCQSIQDHLCCLGGWRREGREGRERTDGECKRALEVSVNERL